MCGDHESGGVECGGEWEEWRCVGGVRGMVGGVELTLGVGICRWGR